MLARLALLATFAVLLAAPAAAVAQDPFGPLPQAPPEQPPPPAPERDDDGDGLNSTQQLLIGLTGFVLLFGIGWAIVRDARQAAPADDRRSPRTDAALAGEPGAGRGSRPTKTQRKTSNRARARAARQARKRNR